MEKKDFVIGVLGGMGTYATIDLFRKYALTFPAEKEWDRPRIIIDNKCTMPSRVRAILYNESIDYLVNEMSESLNCLIKSGAKRIILACNTSHLFLPHIFNQNPQIKDYVVNIIELTVNEIVAKSVKRVYLLASEGTIESKVYEKRFSEFDLICDYPSKDEYDKLRYCIESVKQNYYTEKTKLFFLELINKRTNIILGCTELPVLYEKYKDELKKITVFDPIQITLNILKNEFEECL